MPDQTEKNATAFYRNIQIFQEKLPDIASLDGLINLSCSLLPASLYICDGKGALLGHSVIDARACAKWRRTVTTGKMEKETLRSTLVPKPMCNVQPEPACQGNPCARLSFPMEIGEARLPGVLIFFFWDGMPDQDERYLATVIAGTFAHFLKNKRIMGDRQVNRIQLFRELLQYKPGLRSYYESCIAMEKLGVSGGAYRLIRIPLDETRMNEAGALMAGLREILQDAWVFIHQENILIFFNEHSIDPSDLCERLLPILQMDGLYGCMSMDFTDLLEMRHIFEDIGAIGQIAHAKAPGNCIYRSEQYLSVAFLHKCRQYFSLNEYYPERFAKLIELDRAEGKGYLATLSAYLDCGLNVNAASKALYLHRSTVTAQLEKIQSVLGLNLKDSEIAWYLQLCLRIHDLLEG